ncbi:cysteine desulfurase [bacterium BMS3Bbin05]|nr:cysteine desulfurase [bacterium BMS3Bbin05]
MIYLDYNATTPLIPEVKSRIISTMDFFGNPSSLHIPGIMAKKVIEDARKSVASLINCNPEEIIFTSGGTESDNIATIGFAARFSSGHIISSSIEHPAIIRPLKRLAQMGFDVTEVPVRADGKIDPESIAGSIRKDTILISIMHANNETGVIQPIKEISGIAKQNGITFHTDAAQSVGKIDVDIKQLGVDLLSIAGHKYYGPKGIGAIYIKNGTKIDPVIFGASQERGISPGTENIMGIAGMAAASEVAPGEIKNRVNHAGELRAILLGGLTEGIRDVHINGNPESGLPNTLNISIKDIIANDIVVRLKDKMAFSAGSACHSGQHSPSGVLKAMGLDDNNAIASIRLSVGKFNTRDEMIEAVKILSSEIGKIRGY